MSGDFDKSDASERIDFIEADELFLQYFESTFPEFVQYLNQHIREVISRGATWIEMHWWVACEWYNIGGVIITNFGTLGKWPSAEINGPPQSQAQTYYQKLGFISTNVSSNGLRIDWSLKDGAKYP